jgi:hypothetical protein
MEATVGGEAHAIAGATVGLGDGADEPDDAGRAGELVVACPSLRNGGGPVDAPGRRLVGEGQIPALCGSLLLTSVTSTTCHG